jgi:hypothetical protein
VQKIQISLYVLICVAVTNVLSFPVQAASLKNTPFPTTAKQIKVKDTALPNWQPKIVEDQILSINYFPHNLTDYHLQSPVANLSKSITQLEAASNVTQVTVNNQVIYTYDYERNNPKSPSITKYSSNRWQLPKVPPRKTVPESSSVIGLALLMGLLISKKVGNQV